MRSDEPMSWVDRAGRLGATAITILLCATGAHAETIECDGLRRLSDNFELDLQIKMTFDHANLRYRRYENTGRGWELIDGSGTFSEAHGSRVLLSPNRYVTSYIERLSGAYYYIDRSGLTLSLWGHCALAAPTKPVF